ncbi:uncharacterized protein LOC144456507 [Phascolarctos cinereus]
MKRWVRPPVLPAPPPPGPELTGERRGDGQLGLGLRTPPGSPRLRLLPRAGLRAAGPRLSPMWREVPPRHPVPARPCPGPAAVPPPLYPSPLPHLPPFSCSSRPSRRCRHSRRRSRLHRGGSSVGLTLPFLAPPAGGLGNSAQRCWSGPRSRPRGPRAGPSWLLCNARAPRTDTRLGAPPPPGPDAPSSFAPLAASHLSDPSCVPPHSNLRPLPVPPQPQPRAPRNLVLVRPLSCAPHPASRPLKPRPSRVPLPIPASRLETSCLSGLSRGPPYQASRTSRSPSPVPPDWSGPRRRLLSSWGKTGVGTPWERGLGAGQESEVLSKYLSAYCLQDPYAWL